jgi:hypothetical protein
VEIGTEFHDRGAKVFRKVLRSRARTMAGRQDAAIGLAALGTEQLAEVIDGLTRLVTDRGLHAFERVEAVRTLARMGPRYRQAAAGHVRSMLAEPDLISTERVQCAEALAGLGSEFHDEAVAHLTAATAKATLNTNAMLWAARALAGLGPQFQALAAAELRRVADDPLAEGFEHALALSQLAELGARHRAEAVRRLRAILRDAHAEPEARRRVADELLGLGTEFHPEVGEVLLAIVETSGDPQVVVDTCSTLSTLALRFSEPMVNAARSALESPMIEVITLMNVADLSLDPLAGLARGMLLKVLTDPTRSDWARTAAASYFFRSTGSFAETAIETLLQILGGRRHWADSRRDSCPTPYGSCANSRSATTMRRSRHSWAWPCSTARGGTRSWSPTSASSPTTRDHVADDWSPHCSSALSGGRRRRRRSSSCDRPRRTNGLPS